MFTYPHPLAATVADLRSGALDLLTYLDRLCDRIDAVEPHVQALLPEPDRRARLLTEAEALLDRYPDPATRPPLFGAPVGVKDIIPVDGFVTRAGSHLPPEVLARPEAACVSLLKASGALMLGKTVTTEFAFFEPGPTRNPHNLEHTPGGSSSGSAAAVAAGLAPLSLGTQTIGSVIRPAAFCGVAGFKPTYGRLPADGIVFFSRAVDHVGLFTQDVAGAALAASCLVDGWRPISAAVLPRLGIPAGPYLAQASAEALAAFESQTARLQAAGYEVVRAPLFAGIDAINQRHRRLIAFEFAQEHNRLFAVFESLYRPRTAALIREGQAVAPAEAAEIRDGRGALRAEMEAVMDAHGIDLWLCPPAPGPAPAGLGSTGDPIMNLPWTYAGLPAITLPAGQAANGLPLGVQVVGRWSADESLLAWAEGIRVTVRENEADRR